MLHLWQSDWEQMGRLSAAPANGDHGRRCIGPAEFATLLLPPDVALPCWPDWEAAQLSPAGEVRQTDVEGIVAIPENNDLMDKFKSLLWLHNLRTIKFVLLYLYNCFFSFCPSLNLHSSMLSWLFSKDQPWADIASRKASATILEGHLKLRSLGLIKKTPEVCLIWIEKLIYIVVYIQNLNA